MKIIKKTGLVAVHGKHDKRVFGVLPGIALKGVAEGSLFLVDIPDDIETVDLETPAPEKTAKVVEVDGVVQIPDNWEELHYATQIVLAKNIVGGDLPESEEKKPVEIAREIIREELARRADDGASHEAE